MKVLDLSGFMFSGKAAVHALLQEVDGFFMPDQRQEFDLLRVKDGVADLELAMTHWSAIRADEAVRKFLKIVKKIAAPNQGWERLFMPGFNYQSRYPDLVPLADSFIKKITVRQWRMHSPFHLLEMGPLEIALFKLKRFFFNQHENVDFRLTTTVDFRTHLRDFLDAVLSSHIDTDQYHTVVTNNAFEPFEPARFVRFFNHAQSIVVDRDPRDIFIESNRVSRGFNDQLHVYQTMVGGQDVGLFIERSREYRRNISSENSERVFRVNFESLVRDYETTVRSIFEFLNVDPATHSRKRQFFNPEISAANVGIWKSYSNQEEIKLIAKALPELCYG